jgi:hypothetical protein
MHKSGLVVLVSANTCWDKLQPGISSAVVHGVAVLTEEQPMRYIRVPHAQPWRRAGWPAALNAAVETALVAEPVRPQQGVAWAR